ncbi:MAG: IS21-like element helper ATPase IstB [Aggregatilineales bacterium]
MNTLSQLDVLLKQLRLSGMVDSLEARCRQAVDGEWSYLEFLSRLLQDEVERRAQKQLALRLRRANLRSDKTLDTFDFKADPSLNRQQVLQLASCDFIRQARNVLICGKSGTGKTHLATALAHEACRQGFSVVFIPTHKLLQQLAGGRAEGSLDRRLALYLRPDLLILDDFGLKPLTATGAEDLYDVIAERYEHASLLLTSNRAPAEWLDWFANPLLASAGLDRLLHHAETLLLTGSSFRAKGRQLLHPPTDLSPSPPVMELAKEK